MNRRASSAAPVEPGPGLPILLASLSSLGPFSIDTYLPSFEDIARSLHASQLEVQQTLTAYMLPFAVLTPWYGALADHLGRRRVIMTSLGVFSLASIGCALAPNIETLWLFRGLQGGTAGAGMVAGRAIVRDVLSGAAAQRLMSRVTMAFAAAPSVAPLVGGLLQATLGWRSVFVFLMAGSLGILLWCRSALVETLPPERRQPLSARYLMGAYRGVLTDGAFLTGALCLGIGFTSFFIYVMSAPVFLMRHLGLAETQFLWLFGPVTLGMILGSWISSRTAGRVSRRALVTAGYALMVAAATGNLVVSRWLPPGVPQSVVSHFFFVVGMAMTGPAQTIMLLDLFPDRRGLAASCQSLLGSSLNALNSAVLAPLLWATPLRLAAGQCTLLFIAIVLARSFFRRHARRVGGD